MKGLTDTKIKTLTTPGRYGDRIPTLYLLVKSATRKTWVQRLTIQKTQHDLGLGPWPLVTVEDARRKAMDNRRKRYHGEKLIHGKHQAIGITFQEAADTVIRLHKPTWKHGGKSAKLWRATLRHYVFPVIGQRPVAEITPSDVLGILDPIWTSKPETAKRVKHRMSRTFKWAKAQGLRADDPTDGIIEALPNTATLKQTLKMIPHDHVAQAIDTIQRSGASPSTIRCFEFQVLTATRSGEVRLAEWSEIDVTKKMWIIPASRTKTGKEHRVPLSSRACEILQEAQSKSVSALVFPSPRGKALSDATISKLVRENGINGVPHAIARACFRSWCADVNVSREVAEACLAHVVKGVEASYQRSDLFERRRSVMQKWSDYVTDTTSADVIPLHG
ncbi:MAG: tyrosine-type recombinase/integrase [Paracoccaceae bacterium]|nr:tyrosine-type recombinase/integrase [Nitrospira sp.]MDE2917713.1 tyrosine-type recombinase/integrase [Paracoccaceae bacterium]